MCGRTARTVRRGEGPGIQPVLPTPIIDGCTPAACDVFLGSFCIFGENPEVRIQNSGEGSTPLSCVLSDGGWLGMVCYSPCFWCSNVCNHATHYTMLFDICQMLNEINRGYLPQKGTKEILTTKAGGFFYRIYRMIRIAAVEGASRESRCDSLWIKTGRALSKRASSGPAGFGPAGSSPCEAYF